MKLTKRKQRRPGWYWAECNAKDHVVAVDDGPAEVVKQRNGLFIIHYRFYPLKIRLEKFWELGGRLAGPLPRPE